MKNLGVSVSLTSRYHLQANRQVEQANQEVGSFLRAYCSQNKGDWGALSHPCTHSRWTQILSTLLHAQGHSPLIIDSLYLCLIVSLFRLTSLCSPNTYGLCHVRPAVRISPE